MNKNLLGAFVLAGTLLVGGVANAANWNGLANYPEVPNSAMVQKRISSIKHLSSKVSTAAVTMYSVLM